MKTLWHRLLHKLARKLKLYGTLDSEKALREKNHKIYALEHKVEQLEQAIKETTIKRHAVVYIDRTVQGAYDQPPPNTDPQLQRRLEAHKRALAEQAEEEERFKQLLDVNTHELAAIRAHPGGITRSGVAKKYVQTHVTGKLKPITLQKQTQKLDPEDLWTL